MRGATSLNADQAVRRRIGVRLRLFGARTWKPLVSVAYHRSGSLHDVAFQPGGPLLAAASHDKSVSLWKLYGVSAGA